MTYIQHECRLQNIYVWIQSDESALNAQKRPQKKTAVLNGVTVFFTWDGTSFKTQRQVQECLILLLELQANQTHLNKQIKVFRITWLLAMIHIALGSHSPNRISILNCLSQSVHVHAQFYGASAGFCVSNHILSKYTWQCVSVNFLEHTVCTTPKPTGLVNMHNLLYMLNGAGLKSHFLSLLVQLCKKQIGTISIGLKGLDDILKSQIIVLVWLKFLKCK